MEELKAALIAVDKAYVNLLLTPAKRVELLADHYNILLAIFDRANETDNKIKTELWVIDYVQKKIMTRITTLLKDKSIEPVDIETLAVLHNKYFALVARRSFHHFILFMEQDRKPSRIVYKTRMNILYPFAYYLNEMTYNEQFQFTSASYMPNGGKTFMANYYTAYLYGQDYDSSALRISFSEDNVKTSSNNIKELITNPRFSQIFPIFNDIMSNPFEPSAWDGWKLQNADVEKSHIAVTINGALPGKRANKIIVLDDTLRGEEEAEAEDLFEKYWQRYLVDISSRGDGNEVKELFVGTMWNPNDVIGRKIAFEIEGREVRPGKFKYCKEIYEDGVMIGVIIQVPMLDPETDETTCERVMTTAKAKRKRASTDEFLWASAYQQDPIAPKGRPFSWEEIKQYDIFNGEERYLDEHGKQRKFDFYYNEQPVRLNSVGKASLDPTRKGKDFVAMPIFKQDEESGLYFLVDAIYRGKGIDEVMNDIVQKIMLHDLNPFVFENNVAGTIFKPVIEERLRAKGNTRCEVIEIFNTEDKMRRIANEKYSIVTNCVFPRRGMYPPNSELGRFMNATTRFSFEVANKNDDAPDSLALFSKNIIKGGMRLGTIETMNRRELGL